jgi:hypothetical protein
VGGGITMIKPTQDEVRLRSLPVTTARPRKIINNVGRWRLRAAVMSSLSEEVSEPAVREMMVRIAANYDGCAKPQNGAEGVPDKTGRLIRMGLRYIARAREAVVSEGA